MTALALVCLLLTTARLNSGSEPALGIDREIPNGGIVLAQYEREETEFARLKGDALVTRSGQVLPKGLLMEASIEETSGKKEYCAVHQAARYCFKDADEDGRFDRLQILGGGKRLPNISVPYTIEHRASEDGSGWRLELVYQGVEGSRAEFTFREFGSDWNAPRQAQALRYEVPGQVVYQGARIEILEATSTHLRYRVLSTFR